jgi:hypothetical protein
MRASKSPPNRVDGPTIAMHFRVRMLDRSTIDASRAPLSAPISFARSMMSVMMMTTRKRGAFG